MAQAEAFLTLADELHFGRAAQRLQVSQPRVSRLIAALERQVGGTLFERTSRRVALTALGEQFRIELGTAYAQMRAALDHARRTARDAAGILRVGFTNTTGGPPLSRLISAFEARNPGCQAAVLEIPVGEPYAALRAGEIDVLINWLALDEPDLTAGPAIDCQGRVLAVAVSHPLARRTSVSVEDLAGQPVARMPPTFPPKLWEALVPSATPSGKPVPRVHLVRSITEIWALVARGLIVHPAVASVARQLHRDDIALIPITGMPPIRLGLIWRTAHCNARIRALAATARSTCQPPALPRPGRAAGRQNRKNPSTTSVVTPTRPAPSPASRRQNASKSNS
jgi:DNA-binding transcriptional LysR family regulator